MTFKAEFDRAFCQKEEKEIYNPGEIGPIKIKRVEVLLKELRSLSAKEQAYL